jgi:hypothetical protein
MVVDLKRDERSSGSIHIFLENEEKKKRVMLHRFQWQSVNRHWRRHGI